MNKDTVKEVRIALIRREWTQGDLACKLGVSAAYLSLVLKGRRSVPALEDRILRELGVPGTGVGVKTSGEKQPVPVPSAG